MNWNVIHHGSFLVWDWVSKQEKRRGRVKEEEEDKIGERRREKRHGRELRRELRETTIPCVEREVTIPKVLRRKQARESGAVKCAREMGEKNLARFYPTPYKLKRNI